jgi:hypothetical protein
MNFVPQRVKGILNNNYFCQSLKMSLAKAAQVNGISATPSYLKYEYIETVDIQTVALLTLLSG